MHISRSIAPFLHATRVPFSQSTINFDNFFVPPISPLAVRNCFCLTQAVSLCGKIKRRRRLLSFPDDRTKLTDPSEWLQRNLAPPTSPAVFKTARVRLFATHSHHPLVVSICHHLAKIIVLYLPRPLGYDCNDFAHT